MKKYNTIDSFLEDWKNKAREYYISRLDEYSIIREKYTKALNEYTDNDAKSSYKENLNVVYNELNDYQKNPPYSKSIFKIVDSMYYNRKLNRPCPLENILDKEVANKKATFIARIEKKAGTVKNVDLNIGVFPKKISFNAALLYASVPCVSPAADGKPSISPSASASTIVTCCLLDKASNGNACKPGNNCPRSEF